MTEEGEEVREERQTISVFGIEDSAETRAFLRKKSSELSLERRDVPVDQLRQRISDFVNDMRRIIDDLPDRVGTYGLEEVVVSAEISAKGSVSLFGSGAEIGGTGGLSFTFRKHHRSVAPS